MDGVTARLARFVASVKFSDLPPTVVQRTKEAILDSIGCALGGYVTDRAKVALDVGQCFGASPEATIIGYRKASCASASFVNGELINCMDFDLTGPMHGHVAPYSIPPALALCEANARPGTDLITSVAVGLEIGGRMLASLSHLHLPTKTPPYYEKAPRFSYTSAIFGGVAGACKSLGMDQAMISNAFGIGGTSTPIPGGQKWEFLEGPGVNLKYGCWAGWIAMLGAMAALATQKGTTGDPAILDGQYGYWQMYGSPFFKQDVLLGDLGKVWKTEKLNFKSYPCCYMDHTSIEAIQNVVSENSIEPEEIDEILVYGVPLMLTPNRWPAEITTNEDAQFAHSYLWALAACVKGRPGPEWQMPEMFNDSRIKSLMPKIKVKEHPRTMELMGEKLKVGSYSNFRNALVEITARGKKFTTEVNITKGEPPRLMTETELVDKFTHNVQFSLLKRGRAEQIVEAVWKLDKLEDVNALTGLLTV